MGLGPGRRTGKHYYINMARIGSRRWQQRIIIHYRISYRETALLIPNASIRPSSKSDGRPTPLVLDYGAALESAGPHEATAKDRTSRPPTCP